MRPLSRFAVASLVVGHALASPSAEAAPPSPSAPTAAADAATSPAEAAGRRLFDEGMALFKDARYAEACPKFEQSLAQFSGIGTRGKLAECYERIGRYVSAWTKYREVAQLAALSGDTARERVATERAKSLEPRLSYVVVELSASNDVPGLVITRDGVELTASRVGVAEPVDAGTTTFEVRAPGRATKTQSVTVGVAQRAVFHVPALLSTGEEPAPSYEAESGERPWQRPVGLGLGGVGVASLLVGSVLGLMARSTYDDAFDSGRCSEATKTCDATGQRDVDDAYAKATASTVLFAAGAALAVGGGILFFTAPSREAREPTDPVARARSGLRVAPVVTRGGAGVVGGFTF